MKKLFLFVAVVSAAMFTSCTKDRTCTCTTTTNTTTTSDQPGFTDTPTATSNTEAITYQKSKKGDARSNCLNATWSDVNTQTISGYTYTQTTAHVRSACDLK